MNAETTEQDAFYILLCGLFVFKNDKGMIGLKKSSDFKKVYRKRDLRSDDLLVIYKLKNDLGCNRIGISVSKKVGNSVVRHRKKRQIKEIVRLNASCIKQGYDLVVVVRNKASERGVEYPDLVSSFARLLKRHRLWVE